LQRPRRVRRCKSGRIARPIRSALCSSGGACPTTSSCVGSERVFIDSGPKERRPTAHSSFCSSSRALLSRSRACQLGKLPTTSLRHETSWSSRPREVVDLIWRVAGEGGWRSAARNASRSALQGRGRWPGRAGRRRCAGRGPAARPGGPDQDSAPARGPGGGRGDQLDPAPARLTILPQEGAPELQGLDRPHLRYLPSPVGRTPTAIHTIREITRPLSPHLLESDLQLQGGYSAPRGRVGRAWTWTSSLRQIRLTWPLEMPFWPGSTERVPTPCLETSWTTECSAHSCPRRGSSRLGKGLPAAWGGLPALPALVECGAHQLSSLASISSWAGSPRPRRNSGRLPAPASGAGLTPLLATQPPHLSRQSSGASLDSS
jgi:hypothetical protein